MLDAESVYNGDITRRLLFDHGHILTVNQLDFEALVRPVAGPNPAGEDLRADTSPTAPHLRIREARSQARRIERERYLGDESGTKRADWQIVADIAQETTAYRSKDLELATYLAEALVRLRGFGGLHDAFRLMCELIEQYWDHLYPLPDEDGVASRVAHLAGLNGIGSEGTLIRPILTIPITAGRTVGPFSTADLQQAERFAALSEAERERLASDAGHYVMPATIRRAVAETPVEVLRERQNEIRFCIEQFDRLSKNLEERCGDAAPHSSQIKSTLEACADALRYLLGPEQAQVGVDQDEERAHNQQQGYFPSGSPSSLVASEPQSAGLFQSREDALRALVQVADYFERNEPHSPLAYGATQLLRWGQTPLPELMAELIPDQSAREHFFTLVGIQRPE